jgi:hypothetical protein
MLGCRASHPYDSSNVCLAVLAITIAAIGPLISITTNGPRHPYIAYRMHNLYIMPSPTYMNVPLSFIHPRWRLSFEPLAGGFLTMVCNIQFFDFAPGTDEV